MQQQPDEMRMTVVDATKFGAVGDGKTDSTNAINECLAWTKSMGYNTVWIPNGTYMIDGTKTATRGLRFAAPASMFPAILKF